MEVNIEINKVTKKKRKMGSKKKVQDVVREQKSIFLFLILQNLVIFTIYPRGCQVWIDKTSPCSIMQFQ